MASGGLITSGQTSYSAAWNPRPTVKGLFCSWVHHKFKVQIRSSSRLRARVSLRLPVLLLYTICTHMFYDLYSPMSFTMVTKTQATTLGSRRFGPSPSRRSALRKVCARSDGKAHDAEKSPLDVRRAFILMHLRVRKHPSNTSESVGSRMENKAPETLGCLSSGRLEKIGLTTASKCP